jgi:hypothetical protein
MPANQRRRLRAWRASHLYAAKPTPAQLHAGATLRDQLIADRGGPDMVSTAEGILIDLIVAAKVKHADAHNYRETWCAALVHRIGSMLR